MAHSDKGWRSRWLSARRAAARRPKSHALTDGLVRPGVLLLTPDNPSDVTAAPAVLAEAPGRIQRLAADKDHYAGWLRADLRESGLTPVIPSKRGRKRKICYHKRRYRERWRIQAIFNRFKDFRRIATRYDKLAHDYASAVALAAVVDLWC